MCNFCNQLELRFTIYLPFLGLALLYNTFAESHKDVQAMQDGWAAISCFGDIDGEDSCVLETWLRLLFCLVSVIFLCSAMLVQFVTSFTGTC